MPGRVIPALIADRYTGVVNAAIPVNAAAGILLFGWIGIHSLSGMWAFVALFGFLGGGVQALFPAALASLTDDLSKMGVRLGMTFSIVSFATLTGPPISGALISADGGKYPHAQGWSGTVMVLGALFLYFARVAKHGWGLKVRM